MNTPIVETYPLHAALTEKPVRQATKVTFPDGTEIKFVEKLPKREALRQAEYQRQRRERQLPELRPAKIPVEELRVGDIVLFMGREAHLITRIEPYEPPAFPGEHWRIAYAEGNWGITLERGAMIEVAR